MTSDDIARLKDEGRALIERRAREYGPPHEHFRAVAEKWSAICGHPVTPKEVCLMMAALKEEREAFKHNEDNVRDYYGYMRLAELMDI